MHEFLYRDVYDMERKKWVPVPHRIVKKTRKFVFGEEHPYSPGELTGSWLNQGSHTFRLDRRMLEQEGYAFVPLTSFVEDAEEIYFTSDDIKPSGEIHIKCIQMLNLT
jgi:hypothetical protein